MKQNFKVALRIIIFFSLLMSWSERVNAKGQYVLNVLNSKLMVSGSSTIHDWHMKSNEFSCLVKASFDPQGDIVLAKINFDCLANSLKGENGMMDDKAHHALNADQFPKLKFESGKFQTILVSEGSIKGGVEGELTISGRSHLVLLPFSGVVESEGQVKLDGEVKIIMSDYDIKPPKTLMGVIKTGDEITIHYEFYFENDENNLLK
jgi:polyisoprenoid-binding protein YceI